MEYIGHSSEEEEEERKKQQQSDYNFEFLLIFFISIVSIGHECKTISIVNDHNKLYEIFK